MTIPTVLGTGGHQSSNQTYDSTNYYSNVGLGRSAMIGNVTNESYAGRPFRVAGTISYLSWGLDTAFGNPLTLTLRKNASSSALAVSIGASTTGWVTDTTYSASVSSGDELDFATSIGLGGVSGYSGSFYCVSARFDASTDSAQMLTAFGPSDISPAPTRKFVNLQGILDSGTNAEGNHQFLCLADGTWQNLACNLESNTFNRSTVVANRINGGNGSMSVSIPSGISGYYEDTSGSDSVNAGDLLDYGIIGAPLTGSGSSQLTGSERISLRITRTFA